MNVRSPSRFLGHGSCSSNAAVRLLAPLTTLDVLAPHPRASHSDRSATTRALASSATAPSISLRWPLNDGQSRSIPWSATDLCDRHWAASPGFIDDENGVYRKADVNSE